MPVVDGQLLQWVLCLRRIDREESQSHDHPVTCMQYNADFHHVISACEGSVSTVVTPCLR